MGDHNDGHPLFAQTAENFHNLIARLRVQRTRRFVCQQQVGTAHNGPGNGYPLALAAGKLIGHKVDALFQSHRFQGLRRTLPPLLQRHIGIQQRQRHIVQGIHLRQQVEALKHKPNVAVADLRQIIVGHVLQIFPVQFIRPGGGHVQTPDQVHQCGFPRAGGAHDSQVVPPLHRQVDILQHVDRLFSLIVILADVRQL